METFGVDQSNAYRELKKCARDLEEEMIEFRRPSKRGKGFEIVRMRWVGRATYSEGEGLGRGRVLARAGAAPGAPQIRFHTQIKLQQASALRSRYSWDLLRLFSQFKSTGRLSITLEAFHHATNAPATCRKISANFAALHRTSRQGIDRQRRS